jgi:hypothetical protein
LDGVDNDRAGVCLPDLLTDRLQIVLVEDEQLLCLSDLQALGPQLDLAGDSSPEM